ncbi:unnamed protein product [Diamesa hyperborea]
MAKEHEEKFNKQFLALTKETSETKYILSDSITSIKEFIQDTKDKLDRGDLELELVKSRRDCGDFDLERTMDDLLEELPVGVKIDINFEKSQYKLIDINQMENSLRMLFGDSLKCDPLLTHMNFKIKYNTKYSKKDELTYEKSFYGVKYNERDSESTPIKQAKCLDEVSKYNDLAINESTFELPSIPQYNSSRQIFKQMSYQTEQSFKNVESEIVQIVSAENLCSIRYKTNTSCKIKVCSLFNMTLSNTFNVSYQEDLIRYFLVNKTFSMIVLQRNSDQLKFVDLISQTTPRYSMCVLFESLNAFTSKELCLKSEHYDNCLNFITKEVEEYHNISKKFIPKEEFIVLKKYPAKITNIVNPNEFYVINLENYADNQKLIKSFQAYYAIVGNRLPCLFKEGVYGAACYKNIWYRVQIMEKSVFTFQNLITCFFVDDGWIKDIHWNSLKMLAPSFFPWHQMANKCSLANIEPMAKYQHNYTKKVCEAFRDLVESSKEITVQNQKEGNNFFLITMNIEKDQKQLNVATMLNNFQLRGSFKKENEETVKKLRPVPKAGDKITPKYDNYRVDVELLNVVSPDEFYVAFKDQKEDVQKLHDAIQEYVVANEMIEKLLQKKQFANSDILVEKIVDWKVNDHCLIKVRATTNGRRQYYRGIVDEISTEKSECRVFLRDKGTKVPAKCIELQSSPDKFIKSSSGAIRCKLACIYPVNKQEQWSRITIDRFQDFSENFDLFAINQCGHKTAGSDNPLPVILWGIVEDSKAGFTTKPFRKYNNLTDILIHEGLVDFNKNSDWEEQKMISVKELRDAPWDLNGWMCDNSLEYEEATDIEEEVFETEPELCSDYKIATNKMRIESWISPTPQNTCTFIGTPSYVDRNCCICINNSVDQQTLSQLRMIIDDLYNDYKSPYSPQKFVANEPCMARWNDNLLYRGIVDDAIDDDTYLVSFVDFGDHANVKSRDMFHEVIAHNLPILSNCYYVSGIEANDMYGKWSTEALDTLHGLVVDKVCQVTLDDKYYGYGSLMLPKWVKQCSITLIEKDINIKDFMLANDFAVEVKEKLEVMSILEEVDESDVNDEFDVLHPIVVNRMKLKNKNQELMDLVGSININESINNSTEECRQFMASQPKNSQRFVTQVVEKALSDDSENSKQEDYQSFCNRRAYKQKLSIKPPKQLEELELHTMDLIVFTCEVKCIVTSTDLIVLPLIDEHLDSMERLEDFLQAVDPVQLQSVVKPIVNGIYLAMFSEDGMWYRAKVLKEIGDSVNVLYVDHMNTETVNVENLRQMPYNLYRFKKRCIPIKLFNVKHNEQESRREVKYLLAKLLEGKRLTAVVRKYDDHKIPLIELIDENTNELIYQQLIDKSMLTSLY